MREWWRFHVEEPLDRLPIKWDIFFTYAWCVMMMLTALRGGR